jgi:type II secretory pathway component PulF
MINEILSVKGGKSLGFILKYLCFPLFYVKYDKGRRSGGFLEYNFLWRYLENTEGLKEEVRSALIYPFLSWGGAL